MTLGFTTSKRLTCFLATARSLVKKCEDLDLIREVILVDDDSSQADVAAMTLELEALFPDLPKLVILRQNYGQGLAPSAKLLFSLCAYPYLLYVQDDIQFTRQGPFVQHALEIMAEFKQVKQVSFVLGTGYYSSNHGSVNPVHCRITASSGLRFYLWHWNGAQEHAHVWDTWPHFTYQPSVLKVADTVAAIGLPAQRSKSEHEYALRYAKAGLKTAFLLEPWCAPLDHVPSAFALYNADR